MGIICGHCWKHLSDEEEPNHFDHCKKLNKMRKESKSSSIKMQCPYCNFKSNPSGMAQHMNSEHGGRQRITNMVTRLMADKFNKKKRLGLVFPIDTTRSRVFPEPANESLSDSDQLKFMMERLIDERRAMLPIVMAVD
jgi:hypothetical protein